MSVKVNKEFVIEQQGNVSPDLLSAARSNSSLQYKENYSPSGFGFDEKKQTLLNINETVKFLENNGEYTEAAFLRDEKLRFS